MKHETTFFHLDWRSFSFGTHVEKYDDGSFDMYYDRVYCFGPMQLIVRYGWR
jgi:hypothetical protein